MQPEIRRTLVGLSRLDIDDSAGSKTMECVWPKEDRSLAPGRGFAKNIIEDRELVSFAGCLKTKDIVFGEEPKDDAARFSMLLGIDHQKRVFRGSLIHRKTEFGGDLMGTA